MALSKHPANWRAVRQEFESTSLSIRSLALKFNVPKSTLLNRIRVEGWERSTGEQLTDLGGYGPPVQPDGPTDADPVTIARAILKMLTEVVSREHSDIRELKSLSDTLASCQKVLVAAGPDALAPRLSYLSPALLAEIPPDERDLVQSIFARAEARLAALRDEKVTPIRKV